MSGGLYVVVFIVNFENGMEEVFESNVLFFSSPLFPLVVFVVIIDSSNFCLVKVVILLSIILASLICSGTPLIPFTGIISKSKIPSMSINCLYILPNYSHASRNSHLWRIISDRIICLSNAKWDSYSIRWLMF